MADHAGHALSPVALALRRFWRGGGTRFAVAVLALLALAAVYAPFLAGDVALLWVDAGGWSLPVVTDLFNANSYPKWYDLLFNLAALELPVLAVAWWALRRRWRAMRRLVAVLAVLGVSFALASAPLMPTAEGASPLWRGRPAPTATVDALAAIEPGEARPSALFPPIPHRFNRHFQGQALRQPMARNDHTGARFWLGSDPSGQDVLAYLIFGARISLTIGLVSTGLALAIGTLVGAMSGYFGGWVDLLLERIVEIMLCFPTFVLVLVVVAMTQRDIFIIMVVIGATGWAGTARLVRGEFLAQSVRDYVAAAESLGLPRWRIMFRHILPNALTPLLISATFGVAGAVLTESGLAFLGLGDPNSPSWGILLDQGRQFIKYSWIIYAPGIAIFALVTVLNVIGNGLREALDPKSTA